MPPKTRGSNWRQRTQKRFGTPPSSSSSRDSGELRVSDLLNARSPRKSPYRRSPRSPPRASTPILGNTSIPPLRASSVPLSVLSEPSSAYSRGSRRRRRASSLPNRSPNETPTGISGATLDYTSTGATPRRLIRNILGMSGTRPRTPSFTGLDPGSMPGSRAGSRSGSRSQFSLSNTPPPPLPSLNISPIRGSGKGRGGGGSTGRGRGRGRGGSIRGRGTSRGGIRGRGIGRGGIRGVEARRRRNFGGGGGDSSGGGSSNNSSGRSLLQNSSNFGPLDRRRGKGRKVTVTETRTVTTVRKGKPPRVNRTSRRHSY